MPSLILPVCTYLMYNKSEKLDGPRTNAFGKLEWQEGSFLNEYEEIGIIDDFRVYIV